MDPYSPSSTPLAPSDSFEKHGLDDAAFGGGGGGSNAVSALRTFDAFPKTKASYTAATTRGGQWTVALLVLSLLLTLAELGNWWQGTESHHFSVERGVGHELQLNLDIVVAMACEDLHVNVQDAAMDRILASDLLTLEKTNFALWEKHERKAKGGGGDDAAAAAAARLRQEEEDSHVGHVLGHMRKNPRRKFAKAPRLRYATAVDACRIYGSLEGNKVQGDFHITARGHGYQDGSGLGALPGFLKPQQHLDHDRFNFSHHIVELSFGPHYPGLLNPLDHTSAHTETHMFKFQYFVSIVPTIFTKRRVVAASSFSSSGGGGGGVGGGVLDPAAIPQPPTLDLQPDSRRSSRDGLVHHHAHPDAGADRQSIFTNQYAATAQSHPIADDHQQQTPGLFIKYDIEPILLVVSEQRDGFLVLLVRLVNLVSGVLVGGGWAFQLAEWAAEVGLLGRLGRRLRKGAAADAYLGIGHQPANGSADVKVGAD